MECSLQAHLLADSAGQLDFSQISNCLQLFFGTFQYMLVLFATFGALCYPITLYSTMAHSQLKPPLAGSAAGQLDSQIFSRSPALNPLPRPTKPFLAQKRLKPAFFINRQMLPTNTAVMQAYIT